MSKDNKIDGAFDIFRDAMEKDSEYLWGWHCTIACAIMDSGVDHLLANRCSARILQNIFGVDSSELKPYIAIEDSYKGTAE